MKTKLIIWGLILISSTYLVGNYPLTPLQSTTPLFLSIIMALVFLLLLFVYQTKKNMAKMQQALDDLVLDLKQTKEALVASNILAESKQDAKSAETEEILWDELNQAEKDAHIAKIQKTMVYTGSSNHSEQKTEDTYGTIQIDAYYEMSDVEVRI
jgi:low affinity Fe/Cu permease